MISKVSAPNSVPTDISDYVAQNAHMMAFMNQVNMQAFVLTNPTTSDKPKIGLGSYISHGGSLYKVETADEDIVGSPADGKVYVRVTGDATLSASFVTDISSYNYNHAYGTLTSGSYTLLPYEIRKSGSSWLKYRYDAVQRLQAESLNTGQGDFKIGQNLRPTDNPTFSTLGFASLNPGNSTETSVQLSAGASQVLPKGAYAINTTSDSVKCQMKHGSDWDYIVRYPGGFVISDGVNFRLINTATSGTVTVNVRKW